MSKNVRKSINLQPKQTPNQKSKPKQTQKNLQKNSDDKLSGTKNINAIFLDN